MGYRKKFSLENFKKWMEEHGCEDQEFGHEAPTNPLVGVAVESKVSLQKLLSKIEVEGEGDLEKIAEEFHGYGGTITEVNGSSYTIEVPSGRFILHRLYVRRD